MDEIKNDTNCIKIDILDKHSDEMQDIISKSSSTLDSWYLLLVLLIFAGGLCGFLFFKCPDTIVGNVEISSTSPDVNLVANVSGHIQKLLINNGEHVSAGAVIAVIDNSANFNDVLIVESTIQQWIDGSISRDDLYKRIKYTSCQLGELQNALNTFWLSLSLEAISLEELNMSSRALLANIYAWKEKYLIQSPIAGTVRFVLLSGPNQLIQVGSLLATVEPYEEGTPLARAILPPDGLNQVKAGDKCIISMMSLPSEDYGNLIGTIKWVSSSPVSDGLYMADIDLGTKLVTDIGKEIQLSGTQKGNLSIIVQDQKLGDLILKPVKKIFHSSK